MTTGFGRWRGRWELVDRFARSERHHCIRTQKLLPCEVRFFVQPDARQMRHLATIAALLTTLPSSAAAQSSDYLTKLEHEIVLEHNMARTDPAAYAKYLEEWLPYFEGDLLERPGRIALQTLEGPRVVEEAIGFLRAAEPVGTMSPSPGMSRAARDHVIDLGPDGGISHTGEDGSQPQDRVSRYGRWRTTVAENMAFGQYRESDARYVVMQLLIDDGVPNRGHRTNIFNAAFTVVGVSCGTHATYEAMCVVDYAGGYDEASDIVPAPGFNLCSAFIEKVETSQTFQGQGRHAVHVALSEDGSRALEAFTSAHLDERARILVGEELLVETVIRQAFGDKLILSSDDGSASRRMAEQLRNAPPAPCGAAAAH